MNNHVSLLPDDIIFVDYVGPQDYESIMSAFGQIEQFSFTLRRRHKPVKLLSDVSKVTKQNLGARQAGVESLRRISFDAIAVCGGNRFIKYMAMFFLRASGHPLARYFSQVDHGHRWLATLSL